MKEKVLTVLVRGSTGNIYHIDLIEDNGIARLHCSCKAGENGDYCRHLESILNGETALLENDDEIGKFNKIRRVIEKTDLNTKAENLKNLKQEYESLSSKIKNVKEDVKSSLKAGFDIAKMTNEKS